MHKNGPTAAEDAGRGVKGRERERREDLGEEEDGIRSIGGELDIFYNFQVLLFNLQSDKPVELHAPPSRVIRESCPSASQPLRGDAPLPKVAAAAVTVVLHLFFLSDSPSPSLRTCASRKPLGMQRAGSPLSAGAAELLCFNEAAILVLSQQGYF